MSLLECFSRFPKIVQLVNAYVLSPAEKKKQTFQELEKAVFQQEQKLRMELQMLASSTLTNHSEVERLTKKAFQLEERRKTLTNVVSIRNWNKNAETVNAELKTLQEKLEADGKNHEALIENIEALKVLKNNIKRVFLKRSGFIVEYT